MTEKQRRGAITNQPKRERLGGDHRTAHIVTAAEHLLSGFRRRLLRSWRLIMKYDLQEGIGSPCYFIVTTNSPGGAERTTAELVDPIANPRGFRF